MVDLTRQVGKVTHPEVNARAPKPRPQEIKECQPSIFDDVLRIGATRIVGKETNRKLVADMCQRDHLQLKKKRRVYNPPPDRHYFKPLSAHHGLKFSALPHQFEASPLVQPTLILPFTHRSTVQRPP
jgi:hypothetical protein